MRGSLLASLVCVGALGAGCNTAVGNYFANRARDFGECFRFEVGEGFGLGATARALGLVSTGLCYGSLLEQRLAWRYGSPPADFPAEGRDTYLSGVALEMGLVGVGACAAVSTRRGGPLAVGSTALLPALFSYDIADNFEWIWLDPAPNLDRNEREREAARTLRQRRRWLRVHAFDCEASAFLFVVGASVGFSPGEFVDFLLGWFGVDIAGDDREFVRFEDRR